MNFAASKYTRRDARSRALFSTLRPEAVWYRSTHDDDDLERKNIRNGEVEISNQDTRLVSFHVQ